MHLYGSMGNVPYKEKIRGKERRELGRGCLRNLPTGREVTDPLDLVSEQLGMGFFSFVKCEVYLVFWDVRSGQKHC